MTAAPAIDTSHWRTVRFERQSRYYRLHLEQDLWGAWVLTRVNGRCGSALGRAVTTAWSATRSDLESEFQTAAKRRQRRRYQETAFHLRGS